MAQGFQLDGKVHLINDVQTFDSGFTKREFVLETMDGQYPQMIKFELVRERTALIDSYKQGDQITVHFDIRGNEYQGRYYVNLNCWKIDGPGGGAPAGGPGAQQQQQPAANSQPYHSEAPGGFDDSNEDIPF